jgi:hypothetical protein
VGGVARRERVLANDARPVPQQLRAALGGLDERQDDEPVVLRARGRAQRGAVVGERGAAVGGCPSRSSLSIGVNLAAMPRNVSSSVPSASTARCGGSSGIGSVVAELANRALHLQLDQAVHLDRVLHWQFLDRLDEAVDDQLGLLLTNAVGHQVEELLLADLGDGRLVADVDVVLADADRRVGVERLSASSSSASQTTLEREPWAPLATSSRPH